MKRVFRITGVLLLLIVVSLFVWLRTMSVDTQNYLLWKYTTMTPSETGHIVHRNAHIHYVAYGRGESVLLLHGGLGDKSHWYSRIPWLVASGRRVIVIDTRGHGDSTAGNTQLSYQLFATDTLLVLDKLGIVRTDIIGWSDGGIIALILGLEAPQRVGRIVAISANFNPSGMIAGVSESQDAQHEMPSDVGTWLHDLWSTSGEKHLMLEAAINELWRTEPQLKHADLHTITPPTLVITGEHDVISLSHSTELAEHLPNGKLEVVMGAGHDSLITHAQQVNQLIATFLGIEPPK
jgi:pimeloyl-ACP methyl ester carboxylesterase